MGPTGPAHTQPASTGTRPFGRSSHHRLCRYASASRIGNSAAVRLTAYVLAMGTVTACPGRLADAQNIQIGVLTILIGMPSASAQNVVTARPYHPGPPYTTG